MEQGWIKLHRKVLLNPIVKKPNYLALWVTLLLKANHEPNKMIWNGNVIVIKEGQFITGRKQLSIQTGIPQSTIERILQFLENEHQIGQQKTTKYRLITIVNWKEYQSVDIKTDNKWTTNGQQMDTNKNDKKEENDKKVIPVADATSFSLKEEITKLEESTRRDMNIIALYLEKKQPDIRNKEQFNVTLRRHLKPAKELTSFENSQIINGFDKAQKQTNEWVLETVVKMLTK